MYTRSGKREFTVFSHVSNFWSCLKVDDFHMFYKCFLIFLEISRHVGRDAVGGSPLANVIAYSATQQRLREGGQQLQSARDKMMAVLRLME